MKLLRVPERIRATRVATRMMASVALATLLVGSLLTGVVIRQNRLADRTERLAEGTDLVSGLMALRVALFEEYSIQTLGQLGSEQGALEDSDASDAVTNARNATDTALTGLGDDAPFSMKLLADARQDLEKTGDGPLSQFRFESFDQLIEQALLGAISDIEALTVKIGDESAAAGLRQLTVLVGLSTSSQAMLLDATDYWFAEPEDQVATLSALAQETARFDDRVEELKALPPSSIRTKAIQTVGQGSGLDRAIQGQLDGTATDLRGGNLTLDLINTFSDGFMRAMELSPQVSEAGAELRSRSLARAAEARDLRDQAVLAAIAAMALSVAGSLAFARSISAPLKRLSEASRRVSGGDLHAEVPSPAGPPEVVEATLALNDTVTTLRLIEGKAKALAASDLDADVLNVPLQGGIGEAMSQSVRVLAESVAAGDALQLRLAHDATHDGLSGVYNRAAALAQLDAALGCGPAESVATAFIDLDGFKRINDGHGHAAGDDTLLEVGRRLERASGNRCRVARIGGDEFLLVFTTGTSAEALTCTHDAVRAIGSTPMPAPPFLTVTACAGFAVGRPGDDPRKLLRRADLAAYHAKASGSGSVAVYDNELHRYVTEQSETEAALRDAIRNDDGLELFFQPLVDSREGRPVGVEALLRWRRDRTRLVPPDEFIPIAERSELIDELDRWVFDAAMRQLSAWSHDPELSHLTMAINVSGRHLIQPQVIEDVSVALQRWAVNPRRLTLEVTETALVTDLDQMGLRLLELQQLGVRTSMDDFGTGFTGFAHLRSMPIDEIKIDRSLTSNLIEQPKERRLVNLVCEFAHFIGAHIVAEGVETAAQAEVMQDLGCHSLQGYHFARPLTADAATEWLRTRSRPAAAKARPADGGVPSIGALPPASKPSQPSAL